MAKGHTEQWDDMSSTLRPLDLTTLKLLLASCEWSPRGSPGDTGPATAEVVFECARVISKRYSSFAGSLLKKLLTTRLVNWRRMFGGTGRLAPKKRSKLLLLIKCSSRDATPMNVFPLRPIYIKRLNSRSVDAYECPMGCQLAIAKKTRQKCKRMASQRLV